MPIFNRALLFSQLMAFYVKLLTRIITCVDYFPFSKEHQVGSCILCVVWTQQRGDFPALPPALWLIMCAGWDCGDRQEQFGLAYYLTKTQTAPVSSPQSLTVKDLLLSNIGHTVRTFPSSNLFTAPCVGIATKSPVWGNWSCIAKICFFFFTSQIK